MNIGFTGTSAGMTPRQRETVDSLLHELPITIVNHGDCIGADAEFHHLAMARELWVCVHPPDSDKKRAFCVGAKEYRKPRPYLVRNRNIVACGVDGLIAAPSSFAPPANLRGQGTWTTIGYARQAERRIWAVYPSGVLEER